jgi:predicted enzyme related to lactoylglutathione lyase
VISDAKGASPAQTEAGALKQRALTILALEGGTQDRSSRLYLPASLRFTGTYQEQVTSMLINGKLQYLELPARDLERSKSFYQEAFGWSFTDYGPGYAAFQEGLDGGLQADAAEAPSHPLPVIFASDLAQAEAAVIRAGGVIVRPTFDFPGGRRFHFTDPSGTEMAAANYD